MEGAPLTITVDVGGQQFRTSAETIEKIPFLKDVYKNCQRSHFFVDRSPECFKFILDCARGYSLSYPSEFEAKMRLIDDCHYYRTDSLLQEIEGSLSEHEQRIYKTTSTQATDAYEKATEAITKLSALDTTPQIAEAAPVQAGHWKMELEKCIRNASLEPEDVKYALEKNMLSPIQLDRIATGCSAIATTATWHRSFLDAMGMETTIRSGFSPFHQLMLGVILGVLNKQEDLFLVKSLSNLFPGEHILTIARLGVAALESLFQKVDHVSPTARAAIGQLLLRHQANQQDQ
jgi:BTB/POZ domain